MKYDVVVIGAGFAGAVLARRFAEERNARVLIVEKRDHIAGNAYDEYNEFGVLIHKYGPHIFHTNDANAWKWLSRFTEWNLYQHHVKAFVDGMYLPLPISNETINALYSLNISVEETSRWLASRSEKIEQIQNSRDVVLAGAGKDLYEKFFKNYTFKQWGKYPEELSSEVIRRVPIRSSKDTRYFTDKYQGIPSRGYAHLFGNILDHPNINLMLKTDWFDVSNDFSYDKLVYSGSVDRFFGYCDGKLEYRSVRFEYSTFFDRKFFQDVGTVNYPNDYDFTRISEYKHFTMQRVDHTTIAKEYPCDQGEPFYPVPDKKNTEMADAYRKRCADQKSVIFLGRLAEYSYYNMDAIVSKALNIQIG